MVPKSTINNIASILKPLLYEVKKKNFDGNDKRNNDKEAP